MGYCTLSMSHLIHLHKWKGLVIYTAQKIQTEMKRIKNRFSTSDITFCFLITLHNLFVTYLYIGVGAGVVVCVAVRCTIPLLTAGSMFKDGKMCERCMNRGVQWSIAHH